MRWTWGLEAQWNFQSEFVRSGIVILDGPGKLEHDSSPLTELALHSNGPTLCFN